jgi:hypothetical protein
MVSIIDTNSSVRHAGFKGAWRRKLIGGSLVLAKVVPPLTCVDFHNVSNT